MSSERNEISQQTIFFMGALIFSAVGGILLLAFDFGGWNGSNYYLGVYIWGGIDAWNSIFSIPIAISGFLLLYCAAVSVLVLWFPEKIPDKKMVQFGFYAAALVFTLSLIGGIIFGVDMEIEDVWWWFDAGFYGGIIGSAFTAVLYFLGLKNLEL